MISIYRSVFYCDLSLRVSGSSCIMKHTMGMKRDPPEAYVTLCLHGSTISILVLDGRMGRLLSLLVVWKREQMKDEGLLSEF